MNRSAAVGRVAKEQVDYHDRVIRDPNSMVGKPVIKGTRIPVEKVLDQLAFEPDLVRSDVVMTHWGLRDGEIERRASSTHQRAKDLGYPKYVDQIGALLEQVA